MKQLTLDVPDKNYPFFMELVRQLDFIKVSETKKKKVTKEKHSLQRNIEQGLKEVELAKKGKLKSTSLNDFLNEL